MITTFSPAQVAAYRKYEAVRSRGLYNMFSPQAQKATRLDRDAYLFTMENFDALHAAASVPVTSGAPE